MNNNSTPQHTSLISSMTFSVRSKLLVIKRSSTKPDTLDDRLSFSDICRMYFFGKAIKRYCDTNLDELLVARRYQLERFDGDESQVTDFTEFLQSLNYLIKSHPLCKSDEVFSHWLDTKEDTTVEVSDFFFEEVLSNVVLMNESQKYKFLLIFLVLYQVYVEYPLTFLLAKGGKCTESYLYCYGSHFKLGDIGTIGFCHIDYALSRTNYKIPDLYYSNRDQFKVKLKGVPVFQLVR